MATLTDVHVEDLKQARAKGWTQLDGTDECPRCRGLLVTDSYLDLEDDTGRIDFLARRCVQCGEVIDPVILLNRRRQPSERPASRVKSGLAI
jgi:hypothetical protein